MGGTPEVTIVIPNYNGKQLLENCIETLKNQTFRDFEVLVVDNGSTDGSKEVNADGLALRVIALQENTYIMDTPGFTSLGLFFLEKEELQGFYPEFAAYEKKCRFRGCVHLNEPDCGVKEALREGKISQVRYGNYQALYQELRDRRKY